MDYNNGYDYQTVDIFSELIGLEKQNKKLIEVMNDKKEKIDMDAALGLISTVTAFMRYHALKKKSIILKNMLNNSFSSEIVIK